MDSFLVSSHILWHLVHFSTEQPEYLLENVNPGLSLPILKQCSDFPVHFRDYRPCGLNRGILSSYSLLLGHSPFLCSICHDVELQ